MEIIDPAQVPLQLVDLLREARVAYDMVIADAGLLGRSGAAALVAATRSAGNGGGSERGQDGCQVDHAVWLWRWRQIVDGAEKVIALNEQARAFAAGLFARRTIDLIDHDGQRRVAPRAQRSSIGCRLGLLPVRACAQEQWLMREIVLALKHARPDLDVTVLGDTLDDLSLMRLGNTHVTGPVQATELERAANSYGLDGLFVSVTQPLFGHPLLTAAFGSSRPLAYFDWSNGHVEASEGDLPLDPNLSLQAIVAKLERWMPN